MPLDHPSSTTLCIGDWTVDSATGEMSRGEELMRLEERALRLLLCLAAQPGEVFAMESLLKQVWPDVVVSPDSIYQAITSLRRQLGDDPKHPSYIVNVPRRGYRLIARVTTPGQAAPAPKPETVAPRSPRRWMLAIGLLVLLASLGAIAVLLARQATPDAAASAAVHPRAVAVLPFLDLTDSMSEEPFADGMTEELIGKLSKVPGLAVSPPASSYYFRDKRVTVADVAKALKVSFVLDGSVRKSGSTLRVAARLTRASDGFVVWAETYDRAWNDKLMVQEDIAGEVSKALASSIH